MSDKLTSRRVLLAFYRHVVEGGSSPAQAVEAIKANLSQPSPEPTAMEAVWLRALAQSVRLEMAEPAGAPEEDMPLLAGRDVPAEKAPKSGGKTS